MATRLDLSDSYARLGWAKRLVDMAVGLAAESTRRTRASGLGHEGCATDTYRFVRFFVADTTAIPDDLGFLVADVAVNARSCLDMAMQSVVLRHDLRWRRPEYPLVDDVDATDRSFPRSWTQAQRVLPNAHWQAVRGTQPNWNGSGDVPVNMTAIELRDVANVNKHRNLTPVARTESSYGFSHPAGYGHALEMIDVADSPWGAQAQALFVMRAPAATPLSAMLNTQPNASIKLVVQASPDVGVRLRFNDKDGQPFRLPINLNEFLHRVPRYVEVALKRLRQADEWYTAGSTGEALMDWDGTL